MRTPSRLMPRRPVVQGPKKWLSLGLLLLVLGVPLFFYPKATVSVSAFLIVAGVLGARWDAKRRASIAAERLEDSICTFARSFDTRQVDTRIIRAVYEELGAYLGSKDRTFPLRPTDTLVEELKIDEEDLDDMAVDIAYRAGRSMERSEANPYFAKVKTVGDLVLFLMAQPETTRA